MFTTLACSRFSVFGREKKRRAREKMREDLSPPSFFPCLFSLVPNYREPGTGYRKNEFKVNPQKWPFIYKQISL